MRVRHERPAVYYQAPAWAFVVVYTVFGGLVVASWFWVRPDVDTKIVDNDAV